MAPNTSEMVEHLSRDLGGFHNNSPYVLADRLSTLGSGLVTEHGCEHIDAIVEAVEIAYDRYVKPLDIPGIPESIEGVIDETIKQGLAALVRYVGEKFCDHEEA